MPNCLKGMAFFIALTAGATGMTATTGQAFNLH